MKGTFVLSMLLVFVIILPSSYASSVVGVSAGDWAKYSVAVSFEMPGESEESEFSIFENVEWIQGTIDTVSGKNITGTMLMHFENGSSVSESFAMEIGANDMPFFVEPNLEAGDSVSMSLWMDSLIIDGVESRTYAGLTRQVSYVELSISEFGITGAVAVYWDQVTGTLCELSISLAGEMFEETFAVSMEFLLIETNIWQQSGFQTLMSGLLGPNWALWIIVIGLLISATIVTVLILKRRSRPLTSYPMNDPRQIS
jgi:hypothetical protein